MRFSHEQNIWYMYFINNKIPSIHSIIENDLEITYDTKQKICIYEQLIIEYKANKIMEMTKK